jgi:hypothetical protein
MSTCGRWRRRSTPPRPRPGRRSPAPRTSRRRRDRSRSTAAAPSSGRTATARRSSGSWRRTPAARSSWRPTPAGDAGTRLRRLPGAARRPGPRLAGGPAPARAGRARLPAPARRGQGGDPGGQPGHRRLTSAARCRSPTSARTQAPRGHRAPGLARRAGLEVTAGGWPGRRRQPRVIGRPHGGAASRKLACRPSSTNPSEVAIRREAMSVIRARHCGTRPAARALRTAAAATAVPIPRPR